jgi:hypothetical protein
MKYIIIIVCLGYHSNPFAVKDKGAASKEKQHFYETEQRRTGTCHQDMQLGQAAPCDNLLPQTARGFRIGRKWGIIP